MGVGKQTAKVYRAGTHRTATPASTIEKIRPHMALMGITRIANVTGLDRIGIPVVMVTRPNARSVAVSQGKGLDLDSARASALMESVETWHAEHIDLPVIYGTYANLKDGRNLIDPRTLPQVRDSQFCETTRLLWIEGNDLINLEPVLVPFEMVHADYTQPPPSGHGCFHCSTNGLASGNHLQEAQCHAICEVIERDAITLLHHMDLCDRNDRRVIIKSIDDSECRNLLDQIAEADLNIAIWDATTDNGVPTFYGLLTNFDHSLPEHIGAGAGSHPNKSIALSRTITEAVQTRLTYISGARDDLQTTEYGTDGLNEKYQAAMKFIGTDTPARDYRDISEFNANSIQEDLDWLLGQLQKIDIDKVICIDLTKTDIAINVVRVIIPGLEAPHDDDDYVPGPRAGKLI